MYILLMLCFAKSIFALPWFLPLKIDDPSGRNVIDTSVVFEPNGPSKLPATLDIPDGEDSINLRLEVVSPTQFADQINVASSDSDLEPVLRLEVEDDSGMSTANRTEPLYSYIQKLFTVHSILRGECVLTACT